MARPNTFLQQQPIVPSEYAQQPPALPGLAQQLLSPMPPPQQPFLQPGFSGPQFQRSSPDSNKNKPKHYRQKRQRRQLNMPPNVNFQQQQIPPPTQPLFPTAQQQILPFQ